MSDFYFNSRPSARGDARRCTFQLPARISIHAPPRGATSADVSCPVASFRFQFTPLREGRPACLTLAALPSHFNSRPSARGDHCVSPFLTQRAYFNSRPSARGDRHRVLHQARVAISIHAPPRGATVARFFVCLRHPYFNSRPSARGDGKRYAISANLLFNPYKSAWLNNSATQFVEIILVIFHRIIV